MVAYAALNVKAHDGRRNRKEMKMPLIELTLPVAAQCRSSRRWPLRIGPTHVAAGYVGMTPDSRRHGRIEKGQKRAPPDRLHSKYLPASARFSSCSGAGALLTEFRALFCCGRSTTTLCFSIPQRTPPSQPRMMTTLVIAGVASRGRLAPPTGSAWQRMS